MLPSLKLFRELAAAVGLLTLLLWAAPCPAAKDALTEVRLPEALAPGIHHLLSLVEPPQTAVFQPAEIAPVLAFVRAPKPGATLYYSDHRAEMTSAFYEFEIACSLAHVLRYAYNPDVPGYLLMPSSIRYSSWSEVNGRPQPLPRLHEVALAPVDAYLVRGVEQIEITPDLFTGAYYRYANDKLLILCHHEGRRVLISLSKQQKPSDIGKRGMVLGQDAEWAYFYSGQPGLDKAGLGWVESYMYDSLAITVFYEIDPGQPLLRCAMFKWLRAGWADINFVKKTHIYRGLERFGEDFKEILETPLLPGTDEISRVTADFKTLSMTALRETARAHFTNLQARYGRESDTLRERIDTVLTDDSYLNQMNREELEAILVQAYLQCILGKKPGPGTAVSFCRDIKDLTPRQP
jgi:hypothetical protein